MKHLFSVLGVLLFLGMVAPQSAQSQQAQVIRNSRQNTSIPLRSMNMPDASQGARAPYEIPNKLTKVGGRTTNSADKAGFVDPVHQQLAGTLAPSIGVNFEGSSDDDQFRHYRISRRAP